MDCWKTLAVTSPFKYFPPLSDPTTMGIITTQCIWSTIVVFYIVPENDGIRADLPFSIKQVFAVLTATLGFILPLQLNSSLNKNRSCVDNYNAFCGDILALAWECIGLANEDIVLQKKTTELKSIFHILAVMPALTKHHFRGTIDANEATSLGQKFISKNGNVEQRELQHLVKILITDDGSGMGEIDICFMKLLDYIKDFAGGTSVDPVRRTLLITWNRVYGAYGNMGNISSYTQPSIFTYVLNTALVMYSIVLPLALYKEGVNAIWMVAVISYFFLGLNIAGQKVANAFVATEDAIGFQNVTSSQKSTTSAITQVYASRDVIADTNRSYVSKSMFLNNL